MRQLPAQRRDPVARKPPVGLNLRLARSASPDPAVDPAGAEPLEVRPQPAHPGEVVLELRELDLELPLGRVGVGSEDVEDDRGAVDHRDPESRLEVALLARRQLVVARDEVRVRGAQRGLQLVELARPEIRVRVRALALLDKLADVRDAGGAEQLAKLIEALFVVIGQRSDQKGALARTARLGRAAVLLRCPRASVAATLHSLGW